MNTLLHSTFRAATCAALFLLLTPAAPAATYNIPTADPFSRGWYDGTGFHSRNLGFTDNYFAGCNGEEFRNFFIFTLPVLAPGESISGVSLALYAPPSDGSDPGGYHSPDPTETYQLFSIDGTSNAALRAGGTGLTGIFADLGTGISYSAGTVMSPASRGTDVIIPLNAAFLAYAMTNLGGEISLGGAVTSLNPMNLEETEGVFGDSGGVGLNQTRLIVDTVPEPSATALLLLGGAFYVRRRSLRTHIRNA